MMFNDQNLTFNYLNDQPDIIKKSNKKKFKKPIILICSIIFISILIVFCIIFFKRNNYQSEQFEQTEQFEQFKQFKQIEQSKPLIIQFNQKQNIKLKSEQSNELEKFYNKIPASIKCDSNGNFNLKKDGFKKISNEKKEYDIENYMIIFKKLSNEIITMNGNVDLSTDISIYFNDFNFKSEINKIISSTYESQSFSFVSKIIIGSISISSNDIELMQNYNERFNIIANEQSYTNEEKAEKLDDLINRYGYFIPQTIKFGGLFMIDSVYIKNSKSEEYINKLNGKLEVDSTKTNIDYEKDLKNILNEIYSNSGKFVKGGDLTKDNFDDWKSSINNNNAQIIDYENIIKITDLLDENIKIKLKEPLKIINEKYEKRKKYYEIIQQVKQNKKSEEIKRKGNDEFELGIINDNSNLIEIQTNKVYQKYKWFRSFTKTINISTNDRIVGFKIKSNKDDNGEWKIKENPLLNFEMSIKFESDWFCGINYHIIIYTIKFPE